MSKVTKEKEDHPNKDYKANINFNAYEATMGDFFDSLEGLSEYFKVGLYEYNSETMTVVVSVEFDSEDLWEARDYLEQNAVNKLDDLNGTFVTFEKPEQV